MKPIDTIIVGGGVIGSAIAYYMSARGMKVMLLERDRVGSQATIAAAGMLAAQAEITEAGPMFDFARASRALFPQLATDLRDLTGIDIGLKRKGLLRVAVTEADVIEIQRTLDFQKTAGEQAEWLSTEQVRYKEPSISSEILGAMLVEEDSQVDAPELCSAFAQAAAVLGAQIVEFTEVKSLLFAQRRISGVMTNVGAIYSDKVIIASGTWSGSLLAQAGLTCPIYPVKGECFSVLSHVPLVQSTIYSHGCYLVPKKGGRLVVGATTTSHSYNRKVSLGGIAQLLEASKQLIPGIVDTEWEKAWCGLRPQTLDGLPYLGAHPHWKGLYVAAGHYRNGILLSAMTGNLVADWAEGKIEKNLSLESYRVDRHDNVHCEKEGVPS
ncbi:glycine oxidase ThiO [Paenibacillus macquariensis]|uniref:glycine oxidase n=1 Tax=Paenibacillus macquariensis TaxID=948756 RepID=A0ABY1KBF4_9BACL|nr:glycine oxidase ThiO [Paenibacillus macquariensis]MEC0094249.1 glycine oxidase ThiO [Paenibacillus macquariensis]OAB32142.1 glycine oxidase ThiO [Paenibacillus macquariensis subsp. macquariensis]SIR55139.1 glycine oxidase [Paenibacillus macquariensis]